MTLGLAMGYSDQEIAHSLGISLPTLRKYYFSELKRRDMQRARFNMWRVATLARKANEGDVGAMKELTRMVDRRDREIINERLRAQGSDARPEGKKERRRREAAETINEDDLLRPGFRAH